MGMRTCQKNNSNKYRKITDKIQLLSVLEMFTKSGIEVRFFKLLLEYKLIKFFVKQFGLFL